jgi:hypothetical protein
MIIKPALTRMDRTHNKWVTTGYLKVSQNIDTQTKNSGMSKEKTD